MGRSALILTPRFTTSAGPTWSLPKRPARRGYQEKVQPCLDAGIPCIVIARPTPLVTGDELLESQAAFAQRLSRWLAAAKE